MSDPFTVVLPLSLRGQFVVDATGSVVLTCSDDRQCALYRAEGIDAFPLFICPACGRMGCRMDEATPEQCGLAPHEDADRQEDQPDRDERVIGPDQARNGQQNREADENHER